MDDNEFCMRISAARWLAGLGSGEVLPDVVKDNFMLFGYLCYNRVKRVDLIIDFEQKKLCYTLFLSRWGWFVYTSYLTLCAKTSLLGKMTRLLFAKIFGAVPDYMAILNNLVSDYIPGLTAEAVMAKLIERKKLSL